ncbi:hypothetical protein ACIP4W_32050 [Streptomyces sp. NPDC088846]|uniref:hypothetical protein n=1 Tax=unclassified Streptomyces TaxID=2593676 RepID=UPI0033E12F1A
MRRPAPARGGTVVPVTGARTAPALPRETRPSPPAAAAPGTAPGALSGSTGLPVDPCAPAPVRAPGPDHSLALTGSGADRLRRRPDEAGTAAFRPLLVLTFGAE